MLDTPQIIQTTTQPTAALHLIVPRAVIQRVMGPGLAELRAAVAAQNIAITGPWFTHHLTMDQETFDFEICVPVSAPIQPTSRVQPSRWPAMKIARTIHQGPYERLGAAWAEFDNWVTSHGHTPASDLWERYLAGPDANPDPSTFCTELNRPLTG